VNVNIYGIKVGGVSRYYDWTITSSFPFGDG